MDFVESPLPPSPFPKAKFGLHESEFIFLTDDPVHESEPNTISLKREIPVIDVNDNYPMFNSDQYEFTVSESIKQGTVLFKNITISDIDFGLNSMINLFCVQSVACQMFTVSAEMVSVLCF